MSLNKHYVNALGQVNKQAGFLIPLALFIVVGAATLGVAIGQVAAGSRSSAVLLALNNQALSAADAGVQTALHRMYYGAQTRAIVDANCGTVDGTTISLSGVGVDGCNITVNCSVAVSALDDVSLYSIQSQSMCGSGDYETSRLIVAESYMRNN